MPERENVFSMTTDPEKILRNQPRMLVMIGSSALRHAWE